MRSPTTPEPVTYRPHRLFAVLDDSGVAETAVEELLDSGFAPETVMVITPAEAEYLALNVVTPGLLLRLLVNNIGDLAERYTWAAERGACVVRVIAPDRGERERAAAILQRQGAHTVTYFGRFRSHVIVGPPARKPVEAGSRARTLKAQQRRRPI